MRRFFCRPNTVKAFFFMLFPLGCFQSLNAQTFAQMEKGIQVNFGLGKSSSPTLKKFYANKGNSDNLDGGSNAHSSFGAGIGVGFYFVYPINDIMSIISNTSLNYQSSTIYINHIRDSSAGLAEGKRHRISSHSKLRQYFFSENILFRYKIGENKRWAILAGPTFAVSINPVLRSQEESINNTYKNEIITETSIVSKSQKVILNKSSLFNLSFSLGIERKCKKRLRNLTLGALASYSLTTSRMGTTKAVFDAPNSNDKIFMTRSASGNSQINPPLTDFRALRTEFFIRFKFKNKSAT